MIARVQILKADPVALPDPKGLVDFAMTHFKIAD